MSNKIQNEVDIAAILDAFVYLDKQKTQFRGKTLNEILMDMSRNPDLADWAYYDTVKNAVDNNKQLANMRLVSQSSIDTGISSDLLYACTFTDGSNYYVAYRGTGDGKWVDNGEGMYEAETVMQRAAADYFDRVAAKEKLSKNDNVIVTGHSKGGNSAQFVTLASKNYELIDSCYSFDGQGFSRSAIERFKSLPGGEAEYQALLNKMYSINGENDPVHELGIVIIPSDSEHTFYVKTYGSSDIGGWHGLQFMFENGRIDLDHTVEQGYVGKFAKVLSEEMMKLSDEDLRDCALSIMSLIERYAFGGEEFDVGTGNVKFATLEEFCGFISVGIPLILKTALTTEEGRALVGILAMEAINGIAASENGVWKLVGITALGFICAPAVIALGVDIWAAATLADIVLGVFDETFELSDIAGGLILANVITKAAVFLAGNPHIVAAVLTFVAVVSFITFIVQHWDDIKAFVDAAVNFFVGVAAAVYAWAENLVVQATALLKSAIDGAIGLFQSVTQAIVDFGNSLMSAAANFFSGLAQKIVGILGGSFVFWLKNIFGNGTSALAYGRQIAVTVSYLNDLQSRIGILRNDYLSMKDNIRNAEGMVSRVYGYYKESYVRNCCNNIKKELKNAEKYANSIEKELDRKRGVLRQACEKYQRTDQSAANDIRRALIAHS